MHVKWADYLVSKTPVNINDNDTEIAFVIHKDNGAALGEGRTATLAEIKFLMALGKTFALIHKHPDGHWRKDKLLSTENLHKLVSPVS
ncbi:hypothetical protein ACQYRI_16445 [Salmonella enterica]